MLQETTELLRRGYIAVCFLFAGLLAAESGRQQRDAGNVLLAFSAALLCVFVFYMSSDIYCVASGGQMIVVLLFLPVLLFSTPAFAQIDFTGEWAPLYHEDAPERGPGPELGDYLEMPINDAARLRADSWDADRISVVQEYQCRPHAADYALRGLGNIRIWRDIDQAAQGLT